MRTVIELIKSLLPVAIVIVLAWTTVICFPYVREIVQQTIDDDRERELEAKTDRYLRQKYNLN